jgi:hypothetical protein
LTILPLVWRATLRDGADFRSNEAKRLEQFSEEEFKFEPLIARHRSSIGETIEEAIMMS